MKTTVRYELTPVRMGMIKEPKAINSGEDVEKGNPPTLLVGV